MQSKAMKNFMAKLYGFGAAIVIVGAMFKIMHWPGAGPMLVVGLSTEAIIFFFSAFEKPHEDPDWTLVYPELAAGHDDGGDEFGEDENAKKKELTGTVSQQLDQMMEEAKIGPELIQNLGSGLRTFSDNVSKIVNLTDSSVETNKFNENVKLASQSLSTMNDAYGKSGSVMNEITGISGNFKTNLSTIADATGDYAKSMKGATSSLDEVNKSYSKALKAIDSFAETSSSGINSAQNYNKQLEQVTKNLSSINSLYEMELQDSNKKLMDSINELSVTTQATKSYNEQIGSLTKSLSSLNKLYTDELEGSTKHFKAIQGFYGGVSDIMENIDATVTDTKKYKHEIAQLTQNLSTLNAVYGNMLSAMRLGATAVVDNNV